MTIWWNRRKEDRPGKEPVARIRHSRHSRLEPGPVAMVVDTTEGKILGWERGGRFVPLGENCCDNPLECTKCFGRVDRPWWRR